jgi:hypothetical protein
MLRVVWWSTPAIVLVLACAAIAIPMGAWMLAKSRLPSWAKGIWVWPMGDNRSVAVAKQLGAALLLIGAACVVLVVVVLRVEQHDVEFWVAWTATVLLLVVGIAVYSRSVVLSHRKPRESV